MIDFIVGIVKYTALILLVLVLSHIIQIKGTTISRHVENAMNWVSGANPSRDFNQSLTELRENVKQRTDGLNHAAEFSPEDQKQLNQVIQKSSKKK